MANEIKRLYLIWRKGRGSSRIKVGEIKMKSSGFTFSYIKDGVSKAISDGFSMYPDFPDPNKEYKENVLDIFSSRLTNPERSDTQKYYDFWGIDKDMAKDKFYLLAHTQGILPTDNFEFVAEYHPVKGLSFVSEICGLTNRKLKSDTLSIGDSLDWKLEPDNKFDKNAVHLYKDGIDIGYVKSIHCNVFHSSKRKDFSVKVKSIEKNGFIKRAFISIQL